jgi:hypothetical protein
LPVSELVAITRQGFEAYAVLDNTWTLRWKKERRVGGVVSAGRILFLQASCMAKAQTPTFHREPT